MCRMKQSSSFLILFCTTSTWYASLVDLLPDFSRCSTRRWMFGLLDAHFGKLRSPGRFYNLSAKWSHGSPPLWLSGFGVEADWQHWNRCHEIWVFDAWVKYSKIVKIFGRSLEDYCTISWDYFSWIKPWFATHIQPIDTLLSGYLQRRSIAAGTYTTPFLPLNGPRHVRTLTPCLQAVHEEITLRGCP